MGVQSTIDITREQAQVKWVEKQLERDREVLELAVLGLDDTNLEDQIEEDFYNYNIVK